VGALLVPAIRNVVDPTTEVHLKWPNDVLVDKKKVCGVLIEVDSDFLVVGIGCNVMSAPEVAPSGSNGGRPATCIAHHSREVSVDEQADGSATEQGQHLCQSLAESIRDSFVRWIEDGADSPARVVEQCNALLDYSPQFIRNEYLSRARLSERTSAVSDHYGDYTEETSSRGDNILPLRINDDGTLQVITELHAVHD
jgi:hypothetical protein